MINTSSWDQSFVDVTDDRASTFARLRYRSPSDSDTALASMIAAREGSTLAGGPPVRRHSFTRWKARDDIVKFFVPSSSTVTDKQESVIDCCSAKARSKFVSGSTSMSVELDKDKAMSRAACDLEDIAKFTPKSDERFYANMPIVNDSTLSADNWRNTVENETSAVTVSQTPTTTLLFPVGGMQRKPSSSSSVSSVCDSVLDHCTASSWCSSCSDAAVPTNTNPFADEPFLPDSGNGSSDASAEHFRFPLKPAACSPGAEGSHSLRPYAVGNSTPSYCLVANFLPDWDAERLTAVYSRIGQCGFYYGRLSLDAAGERLRRTPVGTFLLRDSADDRYLLSITAQTCRGPTSIRILYHSGLFSFDCAPEQEHLTPTFDCVLRLAIHYVRTCCDRRRRGGGYVLLESSGRKDTPIVLKSPMYRLVGRLSHLSRRAVHAALSSGSACSDLDRPAVVDRLQLVPSLKQYLKDYPYEL